MRKGFKIGSLVLAIALTLSAGLTGCGSKQTATQPEPDKPAEQPKQPGNNPAAEVKKEKKYGPGVTDTSIKLGTWGPMTGPAATYSIVSKGSDAYFKHLNETQGGINGRKITFVVHDDAYQPSRSLAAAKKLVEEDKVFALIAPLGTPPNAAAMPYLTKEGIPMIAPSTGSSLWANPVKQNYFALQTNYEVEGKLFVHHAKDELKAKTIGIFYQNDDFGKEGQGAAKAEAEKLGLKVEIEVPYSPTDVDFASAALQMRQANPDAVLMFSIPKATASFVKELEKIGYNPPRMVSYVCADKIMFDLAGKAWEGMITTSWLPIIDEKDPQFSDFINAMKKHYPQENSTSSLALAGWVYAQLAAEGIKRAGDDLTWENLINSMETFDKWNDSFAYNVSYTSDMRQGQNALFFIKAKNGDYEKISDWIEIKD